MIESIAAFTRDPQVKRLDRINYCLICGATSAEVPNNVDHFIPHCLITQPWGVVDRRTHPFREVVFPVYNRFRVCIPEHLKIDNKKIRAFGGFNFKNIDPEGLWQFEMEEYPITNLNPQDAELQRLYMAITSLSFASVARSLNGELPKDLVKRYQNAADVAIKFARQLLIPRLKPKAVGIPRLKAGSSGMMRYRGSTVN